MPQDVQGDEIGVPDLRDLRADQHHQPNPRHHHPRPQTVTDLVVAAAAPHTDAGVDTTGIS